MNRTLKEVFYTCGAALFFSVVTTLIVHMLIQSYQMSCVPGRQEDCACSQDGNRYLFGKQVCSDKGKSYSICECRSAATP